MKYELKSVGFWSVIKITFILSLILGFILGIFYSIMFGFMMSIAESLGGMTGMPYDYGEMPPLGIMIVIMPFITAFGMTFFNVIGAIIVTLVYNLAAKLIGGLEFELGEKNIQPVQYNFQPTQRAATAERAAAPAPPPPPPPPVEPLPDDIKPDSDEDTKPFDDKP